MANQSYRLMYRFWLDMAKPEEEDIADKIELLKNTRSFSQTIRDGIRLIVDLRNGKTDVLFELFPFVKAKLQSGSAGGGDNGDIKREIARLERLILQQGSQPSEPVMKPNGLQPIGGLKPIAPPPADDDEDMVLTVKKLHVTDNQASQNFLNSMMALQQ